MTSNEHKLMICMFARQRALIRSLAELVKSSQGIGESDLKAYEALAEHGEYGQDDFNTVQIEYQSFREELGLRKRP